MVIAVDFDGTIVENRYPEIGQERPFAIDTLKMIIADRHRVILWTCREGKLLDDAIEWCRERGVEFYAANRDYPEETTDNNPHFTRKLKADLFIDDRNVGGLPDWGTIYRMVSRGKKWRHLIDEAYAGQLYRGFPLPSLSHPHPPLVALLEIMSLKNIIMSNKFIYVLLSLTTVFLFSCKSPKNVAYIQNSDYVDFSRSQALYDARIMPKDILTVTVNTVNPEASAPFNLLVRNTLYSTSSSIGTSGGSLQTYLVDNNGCIEFPVVGTLEVGGLTKSQCEKLIHDKIQRYMNAEENPVVTVRMSNYKISVIGEVNRPGMFTVGNEKINIFEALAQAGDLTIYGVRERVKLCQGS